MPRRTHHYAVPSGPSTSPRGSFPTTASRSVSPTRVLSPSLPPRTSPSRGLTGCRDGSVWVLMWTGALVLLPGRCYASTVLAEIICLSVCVPVTSRYSIETVLRPPRTSPSRGSTGCRDRDVWDLEIAWTAVFLPTLARYWLASFVCESKADILSRSRPARTSPRRGPRRRRRDRASLRRRRATGRRTGRRRGEARARAVPGRPGAAPRRLAEAGRRSVGLGACSGPRRRSAPTRR